MGNFSWLKADDLTKVANIVQGAPFKCLIPAEFGGGFIKDHYQGYGYLGTKEDGNPKYDMYELLAFWNEDHIRKFDQGLVWDSLKFNGEFTSMKEIDKFTDDNRALGIEIGCYDHEIHSLKYPLKLVSASYNGTYEQCKGISYGDNEQGFHPVYRADFHNYRDRNGNRIKYGCILRSPDGRIFPVERTQWQNGKSDLGICITNPAFLKNHPSADLEYASLGSFDLSEWEIVL